MAWDSKNGPLWSRRTNTSLSLSTGQNEPPAAAPPRDYSSLRRNNGPASSSHGGRANPFGGSATTPGGGLTSPAGGGSAFGLGSGAFASFGAAAKTPKTPTNPFEKAINMGGKTPASEEAFKASHASAKAAETDSGSKPAPSQQQQQQQQHTLLHTWVFWTRPPISKANGYIDYDKTLHPMAHARTAEEFWAVYKHLKPPSALPHVTDYHLFKQGVRPIWEDAENRQGGKWVVRLKKGVADRYWEEMLMACIGGQFGGGSDGTGDDDVNGVVLSVRNGEDIISVWTSTKGQRVLKIRDKMRSVLGCPSNTVFDFKSHDESLQQRATIEGARREKAAAANNNNAGEKRAGGGAGRTTQTQTQTQTQDATNGSGAAAAAGRPQDGR